MDLQVSLLHRRHKGKYQIVHECPASCCGAGEKITGLSMLLVECYLGRLVELVGKIY
jgi:hypothetical protein